MSSHRNLWRLTLGVLAAAMVCAEAVDEPMADDDRKLLEQSVEASRNASFHSFVKDGAVEIDVYWLVDGDGARERRDYRMSEGPVKEMTTIQNRDGLFHFVRYTRVENEIKGFDDEYPLLNWDWAWSAILRDIQCDCTFSQTNCAVKGQPCYRITVKTPVDLPTMAKLSAKTEAETAPKMDRPANVFPACKVIIVNKRNLFMHTVDMFNSHGRKVTGMDWGDVDFTPPDVSRFAFPDGNIKTVRSMEDVESLHKPPSPFASWLRGKAGWAAGHAVVLLLCVAFLCAVSVIALKRQGRH